MTTAPAINALVASAAGPGPSPIRLDARYTTSSQLAAAKATADADADVLASLKRPGAQADFAFIEGQDELCQVIEAGDFGAWSIFLHPEQRRQDRRARPDHRYRIDAVRDRIHARHQRLSPPRTPVAHTAASCEGDHGL